MVDLNTSSAGAFTSQSSDAWDNDKRPACGAVPEGGPSRISQNQGRKKSPLNFRGRDSRLYHPSHLLGLRGSADHIGKSLLMLFAVLYNFLAY